MINSKEEIIRILGEAYEQENAVIPKGADRYYGLKLKLIQTSEQFVRSFEYELPKEHSLKGKTKRFIQKVIRKLTRFLTRPYAEQMLKFQESVCELAGEIIRDLEEENNSNEMLLRKLNDSIYNMSDRYGKEFDEYKSSFDEYKNSVEELKNEYAEYKKECTEQKKTIGELESRIYGSESTNVAYGKTLGEHEEAIYKLTGVVNDSVNTLLEIKDINLSTDLFEGYSQAGEDSIVSFILSYLQDKKQGISYLDIGCNHYRKMNNTYHFYKKGIRGVLVEANPDFIEDIKINRPEDIVLNVGVGEQVTDSLTFYVLNGDGLSSFNRSVIDEALKENTDLEIIKEISVPIVTVNSIMKQYFYSAPTICSIDIEGDELSVLKSIDMDKYRPVIYIVETIEYRKNLDLNNKRNDIVDYMRSKGYHEYAFTGINSIFIDSMAV